MYVTVRTERLGSHGSDCMLSKESGVSLRETVREEFHGRNVSGLDQGEDGRGDKE